MGGGGDDFPTRLLPCGVARPVEPAATKGPFVSVINRWRVTAPRPPILGRAGGPGEVEGSGREERGRGEARSGMFPEETKGSGGEEVDGGGSIEEGGEGTKLLRVEGKEGTSCISSAGLSQVHRRRNAPHCDDSILEPQSPISRRGGTNFQEHGNDQVII